MTDPKIEEPCPFCGITAKEHDEGSPILQLDFDEETAVASASTFVRCDLCGATGPSVYDQDINTTEEDPGGLAVEKWNARVNRNPA